MQLTRQVAIDFGKIFGAIDLGRFCIALLRLYGNGFVVNVCHRVQRAGGDRDRRDIPTLSIAKSQWRLGSFSRLSQDSNR